MVKKLLRNFYLTDDSLDDENICIPIKKNKKKSKRKDKIEEFIESIEEEPELNDDMAPKVEFVIEEDSNKEKHIKLIFEFYDSKSDELLKLEIEINKNMYLEIANELVK